MAKFKLTTTGQVERTFEVEADDEAHAKKRFTTYKHDPAAFAPGIVTEVKADADTSLANQRITVVKPSSPVRAVKDKDSTSATGDKSKQATAS